MTKAISKGQAATIREFAANPNLTHIIAGCVGLAAAVCDEYAKTKGDPRV